MDPCSNPSASNSNSRWLCGSRDESQSCSPKTPGPAKAKRSHRSGEGGAGGCREKKQTLRHHWSLFPSVTPLCGGQLESSLMGEWVLPIGGSLVTQGWGTGGHQPSATPAEEKHTPSPRRTLLGLSEQQPTGLPGTPSQSLQQMERLSFHDLLTQVS